jgi:preprotein translocase subunit YajC
MFWTTIAHAMGQAPAQGGESGLGALGSLAPIIAMFAVFYFLLIRPQQKRAKEHKNMLASLQRGDQVITSGGLYGRIVDIDAEKAVLDLGESKVTVGRSFIAGVPSAQKKAESKKDGKSGDAKDASK